LHWYSVNDRPGRQGFRRIEAGPDHPPFGKVCVAPAHQLGFNDLKAIEVAGVVRAIAGEIEEPFGFRAVCEFRRPSKRLRARRLKGDGWR
jgi:hypothetical protein